MFLFTSAIHSCFSQHIASPAFLCIRSGWAAQLQSSPAQSIPAQCSHRGPKLSETSRSLEAQKTPAELPQERLGLAAEHGFFFRPPDATEWTARFGEPDDHAAWKEMTRPVLELYTESTDGSNIEAKDSALVSFNSLCYSHYLGSDSSRQGR